MKPTNYHLFDFLDFDPDLSRDESLWKAYKPTSVYEKDGDICINVPFQKQVLSNDMAPDTAFPREEYTLVIRQYTSGITRQAPSVSSEAVTGVPFPSFTWNSGRSMDSSISERSASRSSSVSSRQLPGSRKIWHCRAN